MQAFFALLANVVAVFLICICPYRSETQTHNDFSLPNVAGLRSFSPIKELM